MKKLLFLLFPLLFVSCWIEPKIGNYEQGKEFCYCDNYDTLRSLIIPEINKTFVDWHWSNDEFDTKYNKYLKNIPVSAEYFTHLKNKGFEFVYLTGTTSETIQCYNYAGNRAYIKGKYFIIIRDNGDAVTFFETNTLVKKEEPLVELPFNLED